MLGYGVVRELQKRFSILISHGLTVSNETVDIDQLYVAKISQKRNSEEYVEDVRKKKKLLKINKKERCTSVDLYDKRVELDDGHFRIMRGLGTGLLLATLSTLLPLSAATATDSITPLKNCNELFLYSKYFPHLEESEQNRTE
ncbi:hypothetical protein DICVIV_08862 [Dictyocaulus viviparus]|uniref:Uncharacterized protein n=1 Tax=Dictyocaulus viviparus TaxID=29172 RepID=A0A0D8XKN3_DICVI|nr:hypothetical protein DICVIV_08862 [Dictyocaulus viviparus]